jgi:predicted acyl esterase
MAREQFQKAVEVDATVVHTARARLAKGDRLRVQVGSSAFPIHARDPNTPDPPARATEARVAENRIHHDAGHPSHVVLPVVPRIDAGRIRFVEE